MKGLVWKLVILIFVGMWALESLNTLTTVAVFMAVVSLVEVIFVGGLWVWFCHQEHSDDY